MATSSSTNFSTNRDNLVKSALRIIGAIAQGESPTSDMTTEASEALNMMVKAWEADGMPLWAIKEYSITLVASTASYRIGLSQTVNIPKPLKVIQAYYENGDIDIPMTQLTRQEYNSLGNKTTEGSPIQFYYDPQREYGDLYLFPVPDTTAASNTVRIVYQRPFEDFDASSDEPDFPQEWFEALKFGLAYRLAPEYGCTLEQIGMLGRMAKEFKEAALAFGLEEGSYFFERDIRTW
jgi:hypothetical protein